MIAALKNARSSPPEVRLAPGLLAGRTRRSRRRPNYNACAKWAGTGSGSTSGLRGRSDTHDATYSRLGKSRERVADRDNKSCRRAEMGGPALFCVEIKFQARHAVDATG